jgi:long-chain acyl-CoA synthetase
MLTSDQEPGGATVLRGPALPTWIRGITGETLVELLDLAVARSSEQVALVMRDGDAVERWTYRELAEKTARVAGRLGHLGVGPGVRVVTWAPNDPWLVAAYFAIWQLGAVVVPLDLRMTPDVAARIGRAAGASLLLAGTSVSVEEAESLEVPVVRVTREALGPDGDGGAVPSNAPGVPSADREAGVKVTPDMLAEILFTSGTTSDPKGVTITHGQMIHNARIITLTAGGLRHERALALIPLSHAYGQMVPLFYGLITGSQATYLAAMTPARLIDALQRDEITAITVVPQFLELIMARIEGEARRQGSLGRLRHGRSLALRLHLPLAVRRRLFRDVLRGIGGLHLETLSCGGARLPEELQLAWESMGVRVVQGYGATECAAIAGHTRQNRRPGTVGPPFADVEIAIAADGELLARGPNMTGGYWNRPRETAEMLAGGWVHTGDAATVDRHGEVVILGRTRDRIALPNGLKVYPEDVEDALLEGEAIRAAVVLEGAPGQLAAVIVPADHRTTDESIDAAVQAANGVLAPHQRVRRWRRWPDADFPRTHTFKVRRAQVAGWYLGEVRRIGEDRAAAAGRESG